MIFTDEDLKRLKDGLAKTNYPYPVKAMLARLEAAEAVCQQTEIHITDETPKMFCTKDLLKAWRKSCGQ